MQRLTGLDASFLYLETPSMHMHVAMTAVFDPSTMPGGYSFERQGVIEGRLHLVPPFRRRLVEVPFRLHHPLWVEDPDFDLDYHVRRIGVPAPGRPRGARRDRRPDRQPPLDRTRPLWEMWVVEGLRRRPRRLRRQGAPLHGRRRVRRRVHGPPLRPRARGGETSRPSRSPSRPVRRRARRLRRVSRAPHLGCSPLLGTTARRGTSCRSRDPRRASGPAVHRAAHAVEPRRSRRTGGSRFTRVSLDDVKA